MPVKVWGAPIVGGVMFFSGIGSSPVIALLGLAIAIYGIYRIVQYINI